VYSPVCLLFCRLKDLQYANALRELAAARAERESYARVAKSLSCEGHEIGIAFVRYHFLKKHKSEVSQCNSTHTIPFRVVSRGLSLSSRVLCVID
jgi:hypothetical protein